VKRRSSRPGESRGWGGYATGALLCNAHGGTEGGADDVVVGKGVAELRPRGFHVLLGEGRAYGAQRAQVDVALVVGFESLVQLLGRLLVALRLLEQGERLQREGAGGLGGVLLVAAAGRLRRSGEGEAQCRGEDQRRPLHGISPM